MESEKTSGGSNFKEIADKHWEDFSNDLASTCERVEERSSSINWEEREEKPKKKHIFRPQNFFKFNKYKRF